MLQSQDDQRPGHGLEAEVASLRTICTKGVYEMRSLALVLLLAGAAQAQLPHETIDLSPHIAAWRAEEEARQGTSNIQWWLWGVSLFDYNNDNRGDVFVSQHNETAGCMILRNNGDNSFTDVTIELLGSRQLCRTASGKPIPADANNDGYIDIIGLWGAPTLLNQGGASFLAAPNAVPFSYGKTVDPDRNPDYVGLEDRNGDSYFDVTNLRTTDALWDASLSTWNIQPTTYQPPVGLPANVVATIATAEAQCFYPDTNYYELDQNQDGILDLIVSGYAAYCPGRYLFVLRGQAGGGYVDVTAAVGLDSSAYLIRAHDWRDTGRLDLLIGKGSAPGMYIANADHTYTHVPNQEIELQVGLHNIDYQDQAYVPDLDGDGKDDLILRGRYSKIDQVWRNLGDGQFLRGPNTFPNQFSTLSWGGGAQSTSWGNVDGRLGVTIGIGNEASPTAGLELWVFDTATPPPPPANPPVFITTSPLPDAPCGEAYSQPFEANGGIGPYTIEILGELPDGMTFAADALNGPAGPFTFTFTAKVTDDATGLSTTQQFTISVPCGSASTEPPPTLPDEGSAFYPGERERMLEYIAHLELRAHEFNTDAILMGTARHTLILSVENHAQALLDGEDVDAHATQLYIDAQRAKLLDP